tara:strand:- start:1380 stop:3623 length:2244 start_codon:yes stop_codon:yes gene_type:complete
MTVNTAEHDTSHFEIRVTSIRNVNEKIALFAGVPTHKQRAYQASVLILVEAHPDKLAGMMPQQGQFWKVSGKATNSTITFDKHTRPVIEVIADSCECFIPANSEALIKFISNDADFAGISENKARKLVETYPEGPYDAVLQNSVETLANACGLTIKTAERLKNGFYKYQNLKYAKWLSNAGVPLSVVSRIIKHHDRRTIELISDNPYRLMDFGLSFDKTSEIARSILKNQSNDFAESNYLNDPRRIIAATDDAMLKIAGRGHTAASTSEIKTQLSKRIHDKKLVDAAITLSERAKKLIRIGEKRYQSTSAYVYEAVIAKRLLKLIKIDHWDSAKEHAFENAVADIPVPLNTNQKLAIQTSVMFGVSVITGGAGTGKTTVLHAVIKAYNDLGYQVQGVAIAGRAQMRLHQVTGCESCTAAKYLMKPKARYGDKYVLIIDEASMIDVRTMFSIVTHLPESARILLVGDVQQLPPIGEGRVFADIINSEKVPTTVLDIVERQDESTGIPEYSKLIIGGDIPPQLSTGNIRFHDIEIEDIESKVTDLMFTAKAANEEVQVVGMTRNGWRGAAGVEHINLRVQNTLNPHGQPIIIGRNEQSLFVNIKKNDRVIFKRNNYDKAVFNGTLGTVISAERESDYVAKVQTDDNDIIDIAHNMLFDLELSYAITVHKAQGSQFKRIIIVLTNDSMLDRSWLYTAITRAESYVDIVGPKSKLLRAIGTTSKATKRSTNLQELLNRNFVKLNQIIKSTS